MAFKTLTMTTLSGFSPTMTMTLPPHSTRPARNIVSTTPGTSPPLVLAFLAVGLFSAAMIFVFGRRGCRAIPVLRGPGVTPDEDDTDPMFPMDEEAANGVLRTRPSGFLLKGKRPTLWDVWTRLDGDLKTELGGLNYDSSEKGSATVTKSQQQQRRQGEDEANDVCAKRGAEWWLSVMPLAVRMYVFEDAPPISPTKGTPPPGPTTNGPSTYPPLTNTPGMTASNTPSFPSPALSSYNRRFALPVPAIYSRFAPPTSPFHNPTMFQPVPVVASPKPEPVFDWTTLKSMKKMEGSSVPTMALEVAIAISMPSQRCPVYAGNKRSSGVDGDDASVENLKYHQTRRLDEYAIGLYEQPWMWER